jgi:hypothetical protein
MLLAGFAIGCADGGDPSGDPAAYLGSWSYSHDWTTSDCPAGQISTGFFWRGGPLVVSTADGGQLQVLDRDGCSATFQIQGSTARLWPQGQSCTLSTGESLQIDAWTLYLYSPATLWPARTITKSEPDGQACQASMTAVASK